MHPDERRFTWRQRKPEVHCRLDFFLLSQGITTYVTKSDILPGYKTDHSMVVVSFILNSNCKGPGYRKLNTSFLSEIDYINQVKTIIMLAYCI